jgi:hypothetical protein
MRNKRVIKMTEDEIQELMYHAATGACNNLYFGLVNRFLAQFEEDLRLIIKEIDYIKTWIQNHHNEKTDEKLVKEDCSINNKFPKNEKIKSLFENMTDEQKQELNENIKKGIEEGIEEYRTRTFFAPKFELPNFAPKFEPPKLNN